MFDGTPVVFSLMACTLISHGVLWLDDRATLPKIIRKAFAGYFTGSHIQLAIAIILILGLRRMERLLGLYSFITVTLTALINSWILGLFVPLKAVVLLNTLISTFMLEYLLLAKFKTAWTFGRLQITNRTITSLLLTLLLYYRTSSEYFIRLAIITGSFVSTGISYFIITKVLSRFITKKIRLAPPTVTDLWARSLKGANAPLTSSSPSNAQNQEEAIMFLIEIGYERNKAIQALSRANGNLERACQLLMTESVPFN